MPNERTPLLANGQAMAAQAKPDLLHVAKILGALQAGKLPTQQQVNKALDILSNKTSVLSPERRRGEGKLSENGKLILEDVRDIIKKLKVWLDDKNKGDVLQEIFYHAQRASVDGDADANIDIKAPASSSEVKKDAQDLSETFRTLAQLVLKQANILSSEAQSSGLNLSGDLILVVRDLLADAAEEVSELSSKAAGEIRPKEGEKGKDAVPTKEELKNKGKAVQDVAQKKAEEAKERVKNDAGPAGDKAVEAKEKAIDRLIQVANHIQSDEQYKKTFTQLSGLARKYYKKTGEAIEATASSATVDGDIYGNEHTKQTMTAFKSLIENLANGKSTDPVIEKGQKVFEDIKNDETLSKLVDDFELFLGKLVEDPDYASSKAPKRDAGKLYDRAQAALKDNSEWKQDADGFVKELQELGNAVVDDKQSKDLADSVAKLGVDLKKTAKVGVGMMKGQAGAFYRDAVNVVVPRVLALLKEIPIPRTEYKSRDLEFVLDNFTITSASFVPDNLVITNHSEFAAKRIGKVDANASIESSTRVRFDGLRFAAKDVSFWVRRPGAILLSEERGLIDIALTGSGLSGDLTLALADSEEDDETYFKVLDSTVNLSGLSIKIHDNYHYILSTLFSPLINSAVKLSIQHALSAQIADACEFMDWRAFDVRRRALRYQSQGYTSAQAHAKALTEEPPSASHGPSVFAGLHSTTKGFIRDERGPHEGAIAIGGEQLLPGKSGPKSSIEQSKKNVNKLANQTAKDLDVDGKAKKIKASIPSEGDMNGAKKDAQRMKGIVEDEFRDVDGAREDQRDDEEGQKGWKSDVFDL